MSLIRNSVRSNFTLSSLKPNHAISLFLRQSPKHFATEVEQPPAPPSPKDSSEPPFLRNHGTGMVYARLIGITKHTLKTDILHMLEGSNLSPEDVKVNYSRDFTPMAMLLQFPSHSAFDNAIKAIRRKGTFYRLDRTDRSQWDLLMPYDGKTVVLQGLPINAVPEDVEYFLSGYDYDASSLQLFIKAGNPGKISLVRFHLKSEAMNVFITKNRGFCVNSQITVRVLQ